MNNHSDDQQLTLDVPGLNVQLRVDPSPAQQRGDQTIFQCAWCGCVVVQPQPANHPLGDCPSCDRQQGWWHQTLPVAGLVSAGPAVDTVPVQYGMTVRGFLETLERRSECGHMLCNGHLECILARRQG